MKRLRIVLAHPHGFCAGVARALATMRQALREHPHPIYCYHELVHNRLVVDELAGQGVRFVETVDAVPEGSTLLFSAHGVAPAVERQARMKNLRVLDATCPFVARAHTKVRELAGKGYGIVLVGHRHHEEVEGVAAAAPGKVFVVENAEEAASVQVPDPRRVGVVTQTTLSVAFVNDMIDRLRQRFPDLQAPRHGDICYATQNRQRAARALARTADCILVLGSSNSSNSRRLVEISRAEGCPARLLENRADLAEVDLSDVAALGITSGASTPESFLNEILADLKHRGFEQIEGLVVAQEDPAFNANGA